MSDKNDGSIIISAKIDDTAYKKGLNAMKKLTDAFCNGTSKRFSHLAQNVADYLKAEDKTQAATSRRIALEQRLTSIMAARAVNVKAGPGLAHQALMERQITATTALGAAQNKATLSSKLFAAAQTGLGKLMKVGSGIIRVFAPLWAAFEAASAAVDYFSSRQSDGEKVAQRYGTTVDALRDKYTRLAEEAKNAAGETRQLTAAQQATANSLRDAQMKEMERIKRELGGRREQDVLFLFLL